MKVRKKSALIYLVLIPLLVASFFGVSDSWAKKKVVCEYCCDVINGQYVLIDGKHYHPIHFKCAACSTPIGHTTYHKKDGQYYCEKCYDKLFAARCAQCGDPIKGDGIITGGNNYHSSCYYNYVAIKCGVCGEIIVGEYYSDYWDNSYHKTHLDTMHRCQYCGRLISDTLTSGGIEYSDGRQVCNICRNMAVDNQAEAEKLLDSARTLLALDKIDIKKKNIELHLVNRDELKKISSGDIENQEGYTHYQWKRRLLVTVSRKFDIYILDGMPRNHYISVAAHELMHVWQYYNAPEGNDRSFCEGSCNYASYLALKHLPDKFTQYLIHKIDINEDPIYGEGFRRVKKLVEANGTDYWLYHLKNNKALPSGF